MQGKTPGCSGFLPSREGSLPWPPPPRTGSLLWQSLARIILGDSLAGEGKKDKTKLPVGFCLHAV